MTASELGAILKEMYTHAPKGESVVMIHLFGIRYAAELAEVSLQAVVLAAGVERSYATEVRKGMNLSRYVKPLDCSSHTSS